MITNSSAIPASSIMNIQTMPPPKKILKQGSQELKEAHRKGNVQLSLPLHCVDSWINEKQNNITNSISSFVQVPHGQNGADQVGSFLKHEGSNKGTTNRTVTDGNRLPRYKSPNDQYDRKKHKKESSKSGEIDSEIPMNQLEQQDQQQDAETPNSQTVTRFWDIVGHSAAKLRLEEVLLPIALPSSLAASILTGIRSTSAPILLFGPPGCGKTKLARAIAGEAEGAFLPITPSDVLSKFVGESEAAIRQVFRKAHKEAISKKSKCAVLFFDEIDALGLSRGGSTQYQQFSGDSCSRRLLAELLIQLNRSETPFDSKQGNSANMPTTSNPIERRQVMEAQLKPTEQFRKDELSPDEHKNQSIHDDCRVRVIIVAATNRPEDCDPALLRRFSIRIRVGLPTKHDRTKILRKCLDGIQNDITAEEMNEISIETDGWSGSDLESLAREAAMAPIRECIRSLALLRRRNRKKYAGEIARCVSPAHGGVKSTKVDVLRSFDSLRVVSIRDFRDAMEFWSLNSYGAQRKNDFATSKGTQGTQAVHYDSSSDDDDGDY